MQLPVMPPLEPMLAKLQPEIPIGEEWLYEPKWDGFRAIVYRDGDEIHIGSRDRKPLERYFPELLAPLAAALPKRCVLDGEIVIASDTGLDFDALQMRIHPADSRVQMLSREIPATYIAFDLLAHASKDLMGQPAEKRRAALEKLLPEASTTTVPKPLKVLMTPQTDDADLGRDWFEGLEAWGLDGLIAKQRTSIYSPGKRTMIKIKHKRTADCVVGGYRLNKTKDGIGSLLLGVYDEAGVFHYVGHTSSFKAAERRELLAQLQELRNDTSFGDGRTPGGPSRWTGARDLSWIPIEQILVCEVAYDHMQGDRFRHAATFVRWRTDKTPEECTFEQLAG
jgi:ATP-dependent DNA ligase